MIEEFGVGSAGWLSTQIRKRFTEAEN